jgi:hypothetical protein
VPIVPRGLVDLQVKRGVERAEARLAPDVLRIMYSYNANWQGEISLFFRIAISDAASSPGHLRQTTQRIIATISEEINASDIGLETYFNFRSQSEQAMLREPIWEPQ